MRVSHYFEYVDFTCNPLDIINILYLFLFENLYCNLLIGMNMNPLLYLAKCALSECSLNSIVPNLSTLVCSASSCLRRERA
jgi:hypothetical protein